MWIATWNVNSVRVRLPRILDYLMRVRPDVLCLQETKTRDETFPQEAFEKAGYHSIAFGQPGYNGVAILAKSPLQQVTRGFSDGQKEEAPARLVTATCRGVRIMSAYLPNGQEMGTEAAEYKKSFYRRLTKKVQPWGLSESFGVICGDFNIAPREGDVYDVARWEKTVHFHPEMRSLLDKLQDLGLEDVVAEYFPNGGAYSWWDYRSGNFARDRGLRIDLILANKSLARTCQKANIDKEERAGEKPSDHVPVRAYFDVKGP